MVGRLTTVRIVLVGESLGRAASLGDRWLLWRQAHFVRCLRVRLVVGAIGPMVGRLTTIRIVLVGESLGRAASLGDRWLLSMVDVLFVGDAAFAGGFDVFDVLVQRASGCLEWWRGPVAAALVEFFGGQVDVQAVGFGVDRDDVAVL